MKSVNHKNVEMKNANALERRRNPLSDVTNSNPTKPNPLPSSSSSAFNTTPRGPIGLDVSEPISVFCSRIHTLNEKKRISNIRDKSNGVELEGLDLPKARLLTVPCRKKQRTVSYKQDVSKDAQLQDYIENQKAYFKEIDEFKLSEEEVESVDELD